MSIWGLVDTFRIKEIRENGKNVLKYEFFDECFQVNNSKCIVEVDYDCIDKIIDAKEYYYMVIKGSIIMLAKNGFTLGNKEEIKEFIEQRMKNQKLVV